MSSVKSVNIIGSDSDHATQPAGPSAMRLSHSSRNYRRRYISESSSDDDELRTNRNLEVESSDHSMAQRPEAIEVMYCAECLIRS